MQSRLKTVPSLYFPYGVQVTSLRMNGTDLVSNVLHSFSADQLQFTMMIIDVKQKIQSLYMSRNSPEWSYNPPPPSFIATGAGASMWLKIQHVHPEWKLKQGGIVRSECGSAGAVIVYLQLRPLSSTAMILNCNTLHIKTGFCLYRLEQVKGNSDESTYSDKRKLLHCCI